MLYSQLIGKTKREAITSQEKDFSEWYNDVVKEAGLAEHSSVRGSMIIKPYGFALWENVRDILDKKIKDTGHTNVYFPLFIPKSFLSREAEHVRGFAKECAVVTHYRLKESPDGKGVVVDPEAKLSEELIVRPTSETIIYDAFSKWISSWRDLPLLINQWANIVRWEMRPRLFLRTTEFLWQEGHTAHAAADEAEQKALQMIGIYKDLIENTLAIYTVIGKKSKNETFPGADRTYTIEALMKDGKALQCGTSHNLGQNFSKSFDIKFTDKDGQLKYVWQTSWGLSTRIIGALVMAHGDNKGLSLPPKIAPIQVIIVPIYGNGDSNKLVDQKCKEIKGVLKEFRVEIDDRTEETPGFKFNEWELRGVPIRIELGNRDLEKDCVTVSRRDAEGKEEIKLENLQEHIKKTLEEIQKNLFEKHKKFTLENTRTVSSFEEFKEATSCGFARAFWQENEQIEVEIKEKTKATPRCQLTENKENGKDFYTGEETSEQWLFSQAY